ncbi:probable 28S ribosomal protein S26, mitochondrial [Diprion similis]|uniref:probable 28S ribosomal protein S26, mitochondrial n=1 Tax=Diprion similis TaxID=362088 RepID=UPI001EF91649|nr:probable 28S ribosomal protein S26, mitochondrial [Diprion similis]
MFAVFCSVNKMLRNTLLAGSSAVNGSLGILSNLPNTVCVQCVRWKRKPLWLGTAKSKLFRIPVRPKIPEDEKKELMRLHNNYRTLVRSIRFHITEAVIGSQAQVNTALRVKEEEEDFVRCVALNDKWNESKAKARNERLDEAREVRKADILRKIIAKETIAAKQLKNIEATVKRVKQEAVTFITEKNIDQAIEDALNNPVNHDWALDLEGTRHHGKYDEPLGREGQKPKRMQAGF